MTTVKTQQSRSTSHGQAGRAKPTTGKGRMSLDQFKAAQRAELDRIRKECGG